MLQTEGGLRPCVHFEHGKGLMCSMFFKGYSECCVETQWRRGRDTERLLGYSRRDGRGSSEGRQQIWQDLHCVLLEMEEPVLTVAVM